jgi:transcriptional regulator with XRE-family HTH domain
MQVDSIDSRPYAERLRKERARLGLSQAQVCTAGGVSKSTQVAYESNQRVPDLEYLNNVAALGVDKVFVATGLSAINFAAKHFDWELHREIISAIFEFATEHSVSIPPSKLSDLIHLLYDEFSAAGKIESATLARALRLVA